MRNNKLWMLAAMIICGATVILTACKGSQSDMDEMEEYRKMIRAFYGENKTITDGNYDKSLAVKCINGTFVGKQTDGIIAFRGIP